ncbi:lipase secretion chaperone [Aquipseudomonas ullengensis]|uniref:Lipase chaperone n=1 Tax=Aquipseudomonas ullengensis TaxID=2759166 RepID=A0A7W4QC15_9GAMM|nr:lipase secretion chaperone [Pseudomonas ullengensis]MBB2497219.1 lipase secretion chaperone [Pseudomonas ullengensis]
MSGKLIAATLAILSLGGLCVTTVLLLDPEPASAPTVDASPAIPASPADSRTAQAITLNRSLRQTPATELADPGPLPTSLQGTRHDVQLHQDNNGQLRIEDGLLRLFDFYLAGLEEEGIDPVLTRIHRDLAAQLQGQALEQARDLLQRYVDYRIALQDLPPGDSTLEASALRQRLDGLNALRQQHFSAEENQVFFARENAENDYMVQRLALSQQAGLSNEQRQQAITELDAQLPDELREERANASRAGELYSTTAAMQAQGASAEEIRRVREQELGSEAADRLAELDQQHAAWQQRLTDYAAERNRLRAAGLSPGELNSAISELQASRFDELERMRVQALDAEL